MDPKYRQGLRDKYSINEFESLYKFYYFGFNLRATDLQAFIGLGQLEKLEMIVQTRNKNYNIYKKLIKNNFWEPPVSCRESYVSNFAFPIIHPNRDEIVSKLQKEEIAVRPLICGSLERQPFWRKKFNSIELKNANIVDDYGLYIPNNHQITVSEIESISNILGEFIK
jgi:CDP-6-deoxy-D-xylo-4-hexulose-3-dehydrase